MGDTELDDEGKSAQAVHGLLAPIREGEVRRWEPPSESPSFARGDQINRYLIVRRVGSGAMGEVYEAYDTDLERKVALKILRAPANTDGDAPARWLREARALARLSHANVIKVHDVGEWAGARWIAMEFVDGQTLRSWASQPRSWREVLAVLRASAHGLGAVHDAGLIHGDIKPDNVMIDRSGQVLLTDFGLALGWVADSETPASAWSPANEAATATSASATRRALGTPAYRAPEIWQRGDAGPASDQFAWSAMAWELLFGARPFPAGSADGFITAVKAGPPAPRAGARVPAWVHRAIVRGLARISHHR